jgi:hypothetical protein
MKDCDGAISFGAFTLKERKERIEELEADFREAAKSWLAAKKEAEANGEPFDLPKPQPPKHKFAKVRGKTQADAIVARLREKYAAYVAKKQAEATKQDELEAEPDEPKDGGKTSKQAPAKPAGQAKAARPVEEKGPFFVLEVIDCDGRASVEILRGPELNSRLIKLQKEYKKALAAWEQAKEDLGDAFEAPKPTAPKHNYTKVETKKEAETLAETLRKKVEKQAGQGAPGGDKVSAAGNRF